MSTLLQSLAVVRPLIEDIYKTIRNAGISEFNYIKAERAIGKLHRYVYDYRHVKTIWQVEKAVDLMTFYFPAKIKTKDSILEVRDLSAFDGNENVLIEGIAGQGKSIFLRHLCATELDKGRVLPLFVELRNLPKGGKVVDLCLEKLSHFNVPKTESLFEVLANSGKVALLLDGFDEVHDDETIKLLIKDLEDLSIKYPALKVIVTSRPDHGLKMSTFFKIIPLAPLSGNDYKGVIKTLLKGDPLESALLSGIKGHSGNIKDLLSTPLMVTLLVVTYKSFQTLPNQLSDFYNSILLVLLQRHDGIKPGYKRPKLCKSLNDLEYRNLFEATCYYAKKHRTDIFTTEKIYESAREAIKSEAIAVSSSEFLGDIKTVTCLLLEEGGDWRFIHKSVQEFFAASFVKRKPESWADQFYRIASAEVQPYSWSGELNFLKEIDTYRYHKFVSIRQAREFLGVLEPERIDCAHIKSRVKSSLYSVNFVTDTEGVVRGLSMQSTLGVFNQYLLQSILKNLWIVIKGKLKPSLSPAREFNEDPLTLSQVITVSDHQALVDKTISDASELIMARITVAHDIVKKAEAATIQADFVM